MNKRLLTSIISAVLVAGLVMAKDEKPKAQKEKKAPKEFVSGVELQKARQEAINKLKGEEEYKTLSKASLSARKAVDELIAKEKEDYKKAIALRDEKQAALGKDKENADLKKELEDARKALYPLYSAYRKELNNNPEVAKAFAEYDAAAKNLNDYLLKNDAAYKALYDKKNPAEAVQ